MTFFLSRSTVHSAKFGLMHAAVTTMIAENHVSQFSEEGKNDFWQVTSEIGILLFVKARA